MKLTKLLDELTTTNIPDIEIKHITNDSRKIVAGCLFLAEKGINSHGLEHLSISQCSQVAAIVYQSEYDISRFAKYHQKMVAVKDLNVKISEIARRFYQPKFKQDLIAITGTNGKTSVSNFIAQFADYGVIGTMGYGFADKLIELSHTTPDAVSVQNILAKLSKSCSGVAMEVSSHALSLHRVSAVNFSVAVFTNLGQDHLDFHASTEDYFLAKSRLFNFASIKTVVINSDDDYGYRLAKSCQKNGKIVLSFGKSKRVKEFSNYIYIANIYSSSTGITADLSINLHGVERLSTLQSLLWGEFNVENIVAAILALYGAGNQSLSLLLDKALSLKGIKGRVETINLGNNKIAIIDYSHTPDALDKVLTSIRKHTSKKIYTVFGCGGDRDKIKRPAMAEVVNLKSDIGIITDDNPRKEKSADIIADILTGNIDRKRFYIIPSRHKAINFALDKIAPGDIVLIAGKGHENYQIIGTKKNHFSDQEVVYEWLEANNERV